MTGLSTYPQALWWAVVTITTAIFILTAQVTVGTGGREST
jgi:hypothetical protein